MLGDRLGYVEILRTHNFDVARAERAWPCFGLWLLAVASQGRGFDPTAPTNHPFDW